MMLYYAEQKAAGRVLPPMHHDDDPHQMGGDFIIDHATKTMLLVHRSEKSTRDRPDVGNLLAVASRQDQ